MGAMSTLPVYFSGEGAEDAVENIPTVYESLIEDHEHAAKTTLWLIEITGFIALLALVFNLKAPKAEKVLVPIVVVLAVTAMASVVNTAGLGGKIRHTEIRGEATVSKTSKEEKAEVSTPLTLEKPMGSVAAKREEIKPNLAPVPSAAPVDVDPD